MNINCNICGENDLLANTFFLEIWQSILLLSLFVLYFFYYCCSLLLLTLQFFLYLKRLFLNNSCWFGMKNRLLLLFLCAICILLTFLSDQLILDFIKAEKFTLILNELISKGVSSIELTPSIYEEKPTCLLFLYVSNDEVLNYLRSRDLKLPCGLHIQPSNINRQVFSNVPAVDKVNNSFVLDI